MSLVLSTDSAPLVTKRELVHLLKISRPTLDVWIDRWPEFPIEEKGSHGRGYKFNARKVCAFLSARKQEEADLRAERDEQLAQLILPFGPEPPKTGTGPSLDDQIKALKLNELRMAQAVRTRALVPADEVRDLLTRVFGDIGRAMRTFIEQLAREDGWPAPIRAERARRLAELQQQYVRDAAQLLSAPDVEDEALAV